MPIDAEGEKRLKRGLHDLSPLFQRPAAPSVKTAPLLQPGFEVQFLTVCVPDHEGDAFLANAYVASRIVRKAQLFASLISILPSPNGGVSRLPKHFPAVELLDTRLSRFRISHQELWGFTNRRFFSQGAPPFELKDDSGSFLIFLDFEPSQFRSLARVALLLDRVVLFVQPSVESLRESYRLIKVFSRLNHEIEFLLLFRGRPRQEDQEEFLFERFSLITSRFLGISPGWLGELALPEKGGFAGDFLPEHSGFHLAPLLSAEGLKRPLAPEKLRFWGELKRVLKQRVFPEVCKA